MLVKTNGIRFSAAFLHAPEDIKRFEVPTQANLNVFPCQIPVAYGIFKKPVFQYVDHRITFSMGLLFASSRPLSVCHLNVLLFPYRIPFAAVFADTAVMPKVVGNLDNQIP